MANISEMAGYFSKKKIFFKMNSNLFLFIHNDIKKDEIEVSFLDMQLK